MGKHSVQGSEFLEITKKLEDLNRNYIELRGVKAQNEFDIIELEKSLNEKTDLIKTLNQTILDKPYLENKENLIGEWVVKYEDSNFSISNQPLNETEANQLREALLTLDRFKGLPQYNWINEINWLWLFLNTF